MIQIRHATLDDAAAISALLVAATQEHIAPDCTTEGLEHLLKSMSVEAVCERISNAHETWVAEESETLAGVCSLRLPSHIYHLFVSSEFQSRGIGRALIETAIEHCEKNEAGVTALTLNASSFALPAYLRMGFFIDGAQIEVAGIRSHPMRRLLEDKALTSG